MNRLKMIFTKMTKFFVLLIVAIFSSISVTNAGILSVNHSEAAPSKDKDIEDPDDEDFGGVGIFSFGGDENNEESSSLGDEKETNTESY